MLYMVYDLIQVVMVMLILLVMVRMMTPFLSRFSICQAYLFRQAVNQSTSDHLDCGCAISLA
jgi:hypothetical protein